jgi:hypothetical protein
MSATLVTLTARELLHAAHVGITRRVISLTKAHRPRYGVGVDHPWQLDIEGACGEYAVAKVTGLVWTGATSRLCDVGDNVEVRTRSRAEYDLIVHPADADDRFFVLVTGTAPSYTIRGFLRGLEAKVPAYWQDPAGGRPAFFVPAGALRPIGDLAAASRSLALVALAVAAPTGGYPGGAPAREFTADDIPW